MLFLHFDGVAAVVLYMENGETKIAPSTPTLSIAATISSPVTCAGQFGTLNHGRCGVFAS
jgi:hypothetical protein